MYKIDGKLFTVTNDKPSEPVEIKAPPGTIDPALKAKIEELEEAVKKERNPAKKKKIQEELDEAKKKAAEQAAAGGERRRREDQGSGRANRQGTQPREEEETSNGVG